jgi:hypothetical protein
MSQLEFGPASFFNTRHCSIARNGVPIGEIRCAMFGQKGSITIGDVSFAAARESILSGTYYLAVDGKRLASVAKPFAFQRLFTVRFGRRSCTLKATLERLRHARQLLDRLFARDRRQGIFRGADGSL